MDRKFMVAAVAALLLVGGVVVIQQNALSRGEARAEAGHPGRSAMDGAGAGGGKSERHGRSAGDRTEAVRVLRSLLGEDPPAIGFAEIEELVKRVSDDDLEVLRAASLAVRPDGRGGWARCAIFAELARRDPEGAFDFLEKADAMREMDFWGIRQGWFSTFRGWAEVDPAAAVARLSEYIGPRNQTGQVIWPVRGLSAESYDMLVRRDEIWKRQAFQEVFAQFARRDPDAAWAALPDHDMAGLRDSAMEGLFGGVEGGENLQRLLELWKPEWNAAELSLISGVSIAEDDVRVHNLLARSDRNSIGIRIALKLAAGDPAAAARWLRETGVGSEGDRGNRERRFYNELARDNPEHVVTLLREDSPLAPFLLTSLVSAHPQRAANYFAEVEDRDFRRDALMMAIRQSSRLQLEDLFPAPGRSNRLPEYAARHQALAEAIDAAELAVEQQELLTGLLREEFDPVIPAATIPLEVPSPANP